MRAQPVHIKPVLSLNDSWHWIIYAEPNILIGRSAESFKTKADCERSIAGIKTITFAADAANDK